MKSSLAISIVTIYGLAVRLMFGLLDDLMGIMSLTFLVLVPVIIGFLTVSFIPKEKIRNAAAAFFTPWITSFVILVLTMLLNIEGSICWIMIYPFFAILAGVGGVIAFQFRKKEKNPEDPENNNWTKPTTLNISLLLLIPSIIGFVEGDRTLTTKEMTISKSVVIAAPSKEVWHELTHINEIKSPENKTSLSNLMGFPKHIKTTLDTLSIGGKRKAVYEKGLYFDETISQFENEKLLVLDIKTDPANIPANVMDEHIVIGGKHCDILQDVYKIEKLSETSCRLTLTSRFSITTPFNWYAGIWANYLMKDILESELELVNERATRKL